MSADLVAPPLPKSYPLALPATLNAKMSATPYYGKQLVWNSAGTRFWVAVPTGVATADGGLYSGTALTSATIAVAATYKVTAVALSADGSTVFFAARAPLHAVYSVAATCAAACAPALVYVAPNGTELRGLSLVPQPQPAASPLPPPSTSPAPSASPVPSPPASATPTPSRTASSSPLATLPAAPLLAFAASSVIVLRVGDGSAALSTSTAPLFLDEYGPSGGANSTWARAQSVAVSGVTLSGTDYTQGAFSRAADQGSLALAGVAAPAGTAPLAAVPWFAFDRVVASFDRSGTATLTPIASSSYDGIIKGVCTFDGSGFWVVGNASTATPVGIGYIARSAASTAITAVASLAVEDFTACAATFGGGLVALRSQPSTKTVFQDFAADSGAGGPVTLAASTTAFGTGALSAQPSFAKAVVTTLDGARSWVAAVASVVVLIVQVDGGIYVGPANLGTGHTLAVAVSYKVTGLALNPSESTLYFTTRAPQHALYSTSAACNSGCAVSLVAQAAANTEFRGLAPAPQPYAPAPSATPSPSSSPPPMCAPNSYRVSGTCAACAAGTTSTGNAATTCTRCAAGTASVSGGPCIACAAGTFAAAGAATCSPCAAGSYSDAAGAATCKVCPATAAYFSLGALAQPGQKSCTCAAGFGWSSTSAAASSTFACNACGAGSSSATNGTTLCSCSVAGATWSAAGNVCLCNADTTSRGTSGAAMTCTPCAASCSAPGTFSSGPCSPTADLACSLCSACGDGEVVVQACSATANTVCAPCPANSYAAAGDVACTACGAGSAPDALRARCVCSDANSAWSRATNACSCFYGMTGSPGSCTVDPTAVTRTPTPSATSSITPSATLSPTSSFSTGASVSPTISTTSTASVTATVSHSPSLTASNSRSGSASPAAGASPTSSAAQGTSTPVAPTSSAGATSSGALASLAASRSPSPSSKSGAEQGLAADSQSSGSSASAALPGIVGAAAVAVVLVAGAAFVYVRRVQGGRAVAAPAAGRTAAAGWGESEGEARSTSSPIVVAAAGAQAERARRSSFAPRSAGAPSTTASAVATSRWTRCTRTATREVYFYNQDNGETVWSLPLGGVIVAELAQ